MDSLTKANVLKFVAYQIDKGLVNVNTGHARKAACVKILEPFGDDEDLSTIDVPTEVLKFNNRNPGQLSPGSLNTYEKRVAATLDEFRKYLASPTQYKGVQGRMPSNGDKDKSKSKPKGAQLNATVVVNPSMSGTLTDAPREHEHMKPVIGTATEANLVLPFPLRPGYLAQIVIPRDMTKDEAGRLCAFITTLAMA